MRRRYERGVYSPKFQGSKKIVVATDLKQRRAVRREGGGLMMKSGSTRVRQRGVNVRSLQLGKRFCFA